MRLSLQPPHPLLPSALDESATRLHGFAYSELFIQYVGLCDWLCSLSTMFSKSIRVVACVRTLFEIANEYCTVWILQFICSPVDGHLCHFHFLAIMNMGCFE